MLKRNSDLTVIVINKLVRQWQEKGYCRILKGKGNIDLRVVARESEAYSMFSSVLFRTNAVFSVWYSNGKNSYRVYINAELSDFIVKNFDKEYAYYLNGGQYNV